MSGFVKIKKGGELIHQSQRYNEEKSKWEKKVKDVSDNAVAYLFEECKLDKGVTLKDVFLLLKRDIKLFDRILGNWCGEIVEDALANPEEASEDFLCLELYTTIVVSQLGKKYEGDSSPFPSFHIWGKHEGEEIGYSLMGCPTGSLLELPLKLKGTTLTLCEKNKGEFKVKCSCGADKEAEYRNAMKNYNWDTNYSLGQILHGILWELSFYGGSRG